MEFYFDNMARGQCDIRRIDIILGLEELRRVAKPIIIEGGPFELHAK